MKKIIQILTIIALLIFIIISIPYLIKTFNGLTDSNNEKILDTKADENSDLKRSNNINKKENASEDLLEEIYSEQDAHFETEKSKRYAEVKEKLLDIGTIMSEFKNIYGYYSSDWDSIVSFAQSQKFNKNINTKFNDVKNLRFIPYSDNQEFHIETGQVETETGKKILIFQVKAHHNNFLKDLNRSAVLQLNESLRMNGKYPGLYFGSLGEDNSGKGNWE